MFNDTLKATGALVVELRDESGAVVDTRQINNMVVTVGKNYIAGRVGSATPPTAMGYMGLGFGTTAPTLADTTLGSAQGARSSMTVSVSGAAITYSATFGAGVATGAVTEAGIFDAATAGNMMARTTFSAINKGSSDTITVTWTVTIN